jgi:hypothetical protein
MQLLSHRKIVYKRNSLKGQYHHKCVPCRPPDILVRPKLTDGSCFNIFLQSNCNATIFKRLFTRSKHWEEIEKEFSSVVQWTPRVMDTEVQLPFLHMCVKLWKFTSRANWKFILRPGGALHMYMFNLHLQGGLLQFNFHFVFTSCEWTFKQI